MAEVQPFRGWRYDIAQVGDLSDVTAPPYDVIDAQQQAGLYKLHPCNVIRLILNREEPGDSSQDDRYQRAARFLRRWQDEGVLMQERENALYVYHQEFDWEGVHYVHKGFLGRVRLEAFGEGAVYPHEQTMPGPKADRLKLTRACNANLSAIFGLYPDSENAAQSALDDAILGQTALAATDHLAVVHRIWPVTDHSVISTVRDALKDKPIFIADGHHRYETALNYQDQLQKADPDTAWPASFVMMMLVGMDDPGLAVLPTHRLISGLPKLTAGDMKDVLGSHFEVESIGQGEEGARLTWDLMQIDGTQSTFGFGTSQDKQWLLARMVDDSPMARLAPEQSEDWRGLGVSILHKVVLEHLLGEKYSESNQVCKYAHLMDEITTAQNDGTCQLACLIAPAGIEHVQKIASQFEKMPPKSTYFYPKLLSGLVFNPLE